MKIYGSFLGMAVLFSGGGCRRSQPVIEVDVARIDRGRIVEAADKYLNEAPLTITAFPAVRSAGGLHEFYSEGDYWWPNPDDPDGPYIRRDGMSNPDNFDAHRRVMVRLSLIVPALTAAYVVTGDETYATHAMAHLRAWFLDDETRMKSHLLYGQAIKGRVTGRGVGIIDTIHLIEVARSIKILAEAGIIEGQDLEGLKGWFAEYLRWMTTHEYGIDERDRTNNHGSCWVLQVSAFAQLVGDEETLTYCRERFKTVLVPNQIAEEGSFPLELARTKPYSYSLFNLDILAAICQVLSTSEDNLWEFSLPNGAGMRKAMEFMVPYIADKASWPYPPDVMYFDKYPIRQISLLFGGLAYREAGYIDLWGTLNPDPEEREALRNFPLRQPVLWVGG
ncbi:MAG: alginate lyase family protein [Fidelibacterota bacterium]|nr:MAG: alginate lyase family protein [Candidatus Neomarinimicrobiota bacterium]